MPLVFILQVPLVQMGKQLSPMGPKKHLLPHSFFITLRSRVPGDCFVQPLLVSFLRRDGGIIIYSDILNEPFINSG